MKVFISWSGEFSKRVALLLKNWVEQCIQSVEAFVSDEDIEKGENWSVRVANELSATNYGLVCLTRDNISAPWIHFEAGALSKLLDSRVSTIAVDVQYSEIKGPLSSFQNTKLEKDDMFNLLKSINNSIENNGERKLNDDKLKASFDAFWNVFESELKVLFDSHLKEPAKKPVSKMQIQQESFDELLQLVRSQNSIILHLPKYYNLFVENEIKIPRLNEKLFDIIYKFLQQNIRMSRNYKVPYDKNTEFFMVTLNKLIDSISSLNVHWMNKMYPLKGDIQYAVEKNFSSNYLKSDY